MYEPVGTSIHPTPLCTKRNTRGDQIDNKAKHTSHYELDDEETEKNGLQSMSVVLDGPSQISHYELDDEEAGEKGSEYMSMVSPGPAQTSHYELDDEDIERKGEDGVPQYMTVVSDGPAHVSFPLTTITNPLTIKI